MSDLPSMTGNPAGGRMNLMASIGEAKAPKMQLVSVKPLTASELQTVLETPLLAEGLTPSIGTLRSSHHKLARLLALGLRDVEASHQTGYSASRISILKKDPAFRDLLTHYEQANAELARNLPERLAQLSMDTVDLLQERLTEEPEVFTNGQLTELLKAGADRSEAPVVSKNINVNENRNFDVTVIKQIKEEVALNEAGKVKFVNRSEATFIQETEAQDCVKVEFSGNMLRPAETVSIEEETERLRSKGNDVPEEDAKVPEGSYGER